MSYRDLSTQLCASFDGLGGLSSMAFRDTWEYSRKWHVHGYTRVQAKTVHGNQPGAVRLGRFTISEQNAAGKIAT